MLLERCPISGDEEFVRSAACVPPCGQEVMCCLPCLGAESLLRAARSAAHVGRGHSLVATMCVLGGEVPGGRLLR
eukprot:836173-Alexandrium_andersonii.AAC.1